MALSIAATAAGAGAQDLAFPGYDADAPIEINADSLEVRQDQKLAIFEGNVVATQGDMRLRAQTLRVYYVDDGEGDDVKATISRIDAIGDVFISSPRETAQGKVGVYDVRRRVITLTGSVVLTQGENVIRGDRAVLDLASGASRMEGGASSGSQERVRALFVPPKKKSEE